MLNFRFTFLKQEFDRLCPSLFAAGVSGAQRLDSLPRSSPDLSIFTLVFMAIDRLFFWAPVAEKKDWACMSIVLKTGVKMARPSSSPFLHVTCEDRKNLSRLASLAIALDIKMTNFRCFWWWQL
jgi:hypothetical protein